MAFPYRLHAISNYFVGNIQIQLIDSCQSPKVHWQCELPASQDGQLALLEALDSQCFVAATNQGQIYTGNYANKQIELLVKLNCISGAGYWLDKTQRTLWLSAHFNNDLLQREHLVAINLDTGELISQWPLTADGVDEQTLNPCRDGRFAFYARNGKPGYKFRQHGIYQLNPNDGEQQYTQLASKPIPLGVPLRPQLFQDKRRGLILMPAADQLTKLAPNSFAYEIQLLDLNTAEIRWTRTIRHLSLEQINQHCDDELAPALDSIAAGNYSYTNNDAWQSLLSCLTGVWFDPDRDEIWLGWQDWHVQKIGLDGQLLSPLYRVGTQKSNGELSVPMPNSLERLAPVGRQGNTLLLDYDYELDQHLSVELPQSTSQPAVLPQQEIIWLQGQPHSRPCIQIPTSLQAQPSPSGCVLISSADLTDTSGVTAALQQLLELMPALANNVAALPQKQQGLSQLLTRKTTDKSPAKATLYLLFTDALGQVRHEEFFYDAAHTNEQCLELIAQIVANFSQWAAAKQLSGYNDLPPFACAACCLARHKRYLPILANYFCAIGGGEDIPAFHINQTLQVIRKEHLGSQELHAFMQKVPWPYHDESFSKLEKDPYDDWDDDDND